MPSKLVLILVVIVSLFIQFRSISGYNFAFTPDQAITMLSLRRLAAERDLTLIGPETDFKGLYYGPFWYYVNIPAYLVGQGDPIYLVYFTIISLVLASILFAKQISFIGGLLFLLSPHLLSTTRFSLNANYAPTLVIVFLAILWKNSPPLILGIVTGLILQVEAALGIFFIPYALFHNLNLTKSRFLLSYLGGLIITLIPQLMFEVKHDFAMTKVFLYNIGSNTTDSLALIPRTVSHFQSFADLFKSLWPYPHHWLIYAIFLLICISVIRDIKYRNYWLSSILFTLFCLIGYSFYAKPLTHWYLYGLYPVILMIYILPVLSLYKQKYRILKSLAALFILYIGISYLFTGLQTVSDQLTQRSDDPSNLNNQLKTVDQAYSFSSGRPFSVYSFVPSVYDFQYHYLFWWYGQAKYGYRPSEITYLPGVPDYIKNSQYYISGHQDLSATSPVIIIFDKTNPQAAINWLNYFPHLCISQSKSLPWRTDIQLRYPCKFSFTGSN